MRPAGGRHPWLAWGILIFLTLLWGSSYTLMKQALVAFNPLQVASLRAVIASLTLAPFFVAGWRTVPRDKWKYLFWVGMFGNGIPMFLFPLAMTRLAGGTAGILNSLSPVFTLVLGAIFFGFTLNWQKVLGVALGFGGATMLILLGSGELSWSGQAGYGLLVVACAVFYGLNVNIMKRHLSGMRPLVVTASALIAIVLPYSIYLLGFSGIGEVLANEPKVWSSLSAVLVLGAMGTAISTVMFYRMIQLTDPMFSVSVTYLMPIVALMWGVLDGEGIYASQLAGMAVILTGVWLVNRR